MHKYILSNTLHACTAPHNDCMSVNVKDQPYACTARYIYSSVCVYTIDCYSSCSGIHVNKLQVRDSIVMVSLH